MPLKVLLVHNRYRSGAPSGEDAAVDAEAALLARGGVEVARYERRNDEIQGGLAAAAETVWSPAARRELRALLRRERPDLAHVHNIWYRISPAVYAACGEAGVPVVQTLHNYRMFCANGLMLRAGRPCEACAGRVPWRAVLHGCYRSRGASAAVALAQWAQRRRGSWLGGVRRFVALSEFARGRFVACGLPPSRVSVKPNFLADPPAPREGPGEGALYVGRLSPEKGVTVLLAAARGLRGPGLTLEVVGDGELRGAVAQAAGGSLRAPGALPRAECLAAMRRARFLVVPSLCYENFPLVVVEAFACGTPVLASRRGALAEIVEDGRTGRLVEPGDAAALREAMVWMAAHPGECARMGRAAREEFEARYTAERNLGLLLEIYRGALGGEGREP